MVWEFLHIVYICQNELFDIFALRGINLDLHPSILETCCIFLDLILNVRTRTIKPDYIIKPY